MAGRKQMKIIVESFVRVDDQLVNTKDLNQEQKVRLSNWLATTYLNHLYAGKAEFYVEERGMQHG